MAHVRKLVIDVGFWGKHFFESPEMKNLGCIEELWHLANSLVSCLCYSVLPAETWDANSGMSFFDMA